MQPLCQDMSSKQRNQATMLQSIIPYIQVHVLAGFDGNHRQPGQRPAASSSDHTTMAAQHMSDHLARQAPKSDFMDAIMP